MLNVARELLRWSSVVSCTMSESEGALLLYYVRALDVMII